jgi:hypothetical protein
VVANHPVKILRIKFTTDLLMIAYYKNNNEPMNSVNSIEFHDLQNHYKLFKEDSAPQSQKWKIPCARSNINGSIVLKVDHTETRDKDVEYI